jgi:hypothetical protein
LLVSESDWNHHLRRDGEGGICWIVDVCIERSVSREERVDDTGAAREGEEERVRMTGESEVLGGVAEGEMNRRLDIRGGGREREWEGVGEEASLAGGGGEGKILSVRASWSAFSIGEGGRDEGRDEEEHGEEEEEREREWVCQEEWEGKRRRGAAGDAEDGWCSWRGSVSVLEWPSPRP